MAKDGLRRARPGKFEGGLFINEYVYDLSLEGWADQEGDVSEIGVVYNRLHLGPEGLERIEEIAKENKDTLTDEERDLISDSYGAILEEGEQGFVSVDWIDTKKEYEKKWKEIEDEVASIYEEIEEQGEGE